MSNISTVLPKHARVQIPRRDLLAHLLQSSSPIRLLCAPAGSGKTQLLAECARHVPSATGCIWLALGGYPLSVKDLCQKIGQAIAPRPGEYDSQALLALLQQQSAPLWIMLDDYPREDSPELDSQLQHLLHNSAPRITWWISSRRQLASAVRPHAPDHSLLAVSADQLWFNLKELGTLLRKHRPHTPLSLQQQLFEQTQGWCAGVCFALMGLSSDNHISSPQLTLQYLQREVLNRLPEGLLASLNCLAQLPHFNHELSLILLNETDDNASLTQLMHLGAFIQPLEQRSHWYRVAPVIRHALAQTSPSFNNLSLHRQAGPWFMQQGDLQTAIEQALLAQQPQQAAQWLARYSEPMLMYGKDAAKILQWRQKLPDALLHSTAELVLLNALTLGLAGDANASHSLQQLGHFFPQPDPEHQRQLLAQWQSLHAMHQHSFAQGPQAQALALEAYNTLPHDNWTLRQISLAILLQYALQQGEFAQAEHWLADAQRAVRHTHNPSAIARVALYQATFLQLKGEFSAAQQLLERQWERLQHSQQQLSAAGAKVAEALGHLYLRLGNYQAAQNFLEQSLVAAEHTYEPVAVHCYLSLAELAIHQGQTAAAWRQLHEAERHAQQRRLAEPMYQPRWVLLNAQLLLVNAQPARAEVLLHKLLAHFAEIGHIPYAQPELLTRAQALLAQCELLQNRQHQARQRLQLLLQQPQLQAKPALCAEVRLTLAQLQLSSGVPELARKTLRLCNQALRHMQLHAPLDLLKHYQPALAELLSPEQAEQILSDREYDVLRLIAKGCSNLEIGEYLFISIHTVKSHIQRIGNKLGARRRTQVLARARDLAILE